MEQCKKCQNEGIYSNMKVGGTAKELIFIDDKNELKEILQTKLEEHFPLGNGTNTLLTMEI